MSEENIKEKEENNVLEEEAPANQVEEKPYYKIIEDARLDLYKQYSVSRRTSNIIMFVVVAAICGTMFLIISNNNVLKIVGYVVAGVLVAGMILYYVLNRNRLPNKVKAYLALVSEKLNNRMFEDNGFSDIKSDIEEKLMMDDLIGDGIYAEANGINSRNVVHGKFNGRTFLYGEAALLRPSTRKQQVPPLFVGRYVSVTNDMKFDGRFVFTFKNPKQPLDLPNAVNDLVVLEEKEDFVVYGPEGADFRKIIRNDVLVQLRKLEIKGHLLNVNVVFWSGHTAAYISYDDTIMSVPFDKPFGKDGFEQSFEDLLSCFRAIVE